MTAKILTNKIPKILPVSVAPPIEPTVPAFDIIISPGPIAESGEPLRSLGSEPISSPVVVEALYGGLDLSRLSERCGSVHFFHALN